MNMTGQAQEQKQQEKKEFLVDGIVLFIIKSAVNVDYARLDLVLETNDPGFAQCTHVKNPYENCYEMGMTIKIPGLSLNSKTMDLIKKLSRGIVKPTQMITIMPIILVCQVKFTKDEQKLVHGDNVQILDSYQDDEIFEILKKEHTDADKPE